MNFYNYFVTKRSLNNTLYKEFSLKRKQNFKTRKDHVNVFLIRFLPYLYTARIWLNLITSKAFRSSRLQMFYKIGVLENFAKFTGKRLCWSPFLLSFTHHMLSCHLCEIFKNTYFPITPQYQTRLLSKQISKVT